MADGEFLNIAVLEICQALVPILVTDIAEAAQVWLVKKGNGRGEFQLRLESTFEVFFLRVRFPVVREESGEGAGACGETQRIAAVDGAFDENEGQPAGVRDELGISL